MAVTVAAAAQPLSALDLLGLDAQLGDEEREVRDMVRRWVRDRVIPDLCEVITGERVVL